MPKINCFNFVPLQFKFIVEEKGALPTDPTFWDYLMSTSSNNWKLMVYEQDWLDVQVREVEALRVSDSRTWSPGLVSAQWG